MHRLSNKMTGRKQGDLAVDMDGVASVSKGNVDEFEKLVERHQKRMLNIAYRMSGSYEDAYEVVQDAFL